MRLGEVVAQFLRADPLQRVRGDKLTRSYTMQIPRDTRTGTQRPQRPDEDNDAAEPAADAAATGQTEDAAEPIKVAATAAAAQTGEIVSTPAVDATCRVVTP